MTRVAIITGANRGIGYAITERLCKTLKDGWSVYLTCRSEDSGHQALESLQKKGLCPWLHKLDVTSEESIEEFADHIGKKSGRVDILVNNAGIMVPMKKPIAEQVEMIHTNFFGSLNVTKALKPLLRSHARIVHVAGMVGPPALKQLSQEKKSELFSIDSEEKLIQTVNEYTELAIKGGDLKKAGLTKAVYGYSKLALMVLAHVQQAQFDQDSKPQGIIVNSCCPGLCRTDMSGGKGKKSAEEGSDTPVYLATLPLEVAEPKGQYVSERKVQTWRS